jgi:hypothetical protein
MLTALVAMAAMSEPEGTRECTALAASAHKYFLLSTKQAILPEYLRHTTALKQRAGFRLTLLPFATVWVKAGARKN